LRHDGRFVLLEVIEEGRISGSKTLNYVLIEGVGVWSKRERKHNFNSSPGLLVAVDASDIMVA